MFDEMLLIKPALKSVPIDIQEDKDNPPVSSRDVNAVLSARTDDDGINDREVFKPAMMLLGILYCRSTRRQRAEKLYQLFDSDNQERVHGESKYFRAYLPKIAEISHKLMFKLYSRHRDQTPDANGKNLR